MGDSKDNVKVAIRIRPQNEKETQESGKSCISVQDSHKTLTLDIKPDKKSFTFDHIASEDSSQADLFQMIGVPISNSCLSGYNGTIFAYGQTGAGKTYTILGTNPESQQDNPGRGLLPRCFEYIFNSVISESSDSKKFLVKCSYLEIYQEQIIDLLDSNPHNLQLREDIRQGVYVEGLIEETVSSLAETYTILKTGNLNRHVASTSMNKESSRSHSVFTLLVESKEARDGICNFRTSRFSLVDLAGSERQKATDCFGERLKEAGMINKSLSALGNVINSLVDISEGKSRHVHYRDSKLTFLLKDSLGGNSKTFMVANVSPSSSVIGETISTLKFAQRAKQIKNLAVVNEDTSGAVAMLRYEVKRLKDELSIAREQSLCYKCRGFVEGNEDNVEIIEILHRSIETKQQDEKLLMKQVQDKDLYINGLKTIIAKLENKANHDKMILKFRDATISSINSSTFDESSEVASLKQEIECLKEMVDNHPQAAKLFVENNRLNSEVQELRNQCKAESRVQELEETNQKILKALAGGKRENEEIMQKLVKYKEKVSKMKDKKNRLKDKAQQLNEKVSQLELVNLTMQTENTLFNDESNLRDFNIDDLPESDRELEKSQKIDEIFITLNEQQLNLQTELLSKLKFEHEIEELTRENSRLKSQLEECKEFREQVWKMENDLKEIESKQREKDAEKDNLEKNVKDLKIQLEVTKGSLMQKQETLNDLNQKLMLSQFEVSSLIEKLAKGEDNYKRVVETNKTYQASLHNFEELQEKYEALFQEYKLFEVNKIKYEKYKQKSQDLKEKLRAKAETIQDLEKKIQSESEKASSAEILSSDMINLKEIYHQTQSVLEKTQQELEKAKSDLDKSQSAGLKSKRKLETAKEKTSLFKDECESLKSSLLSSTSQLEQLKLVKITAEETSMYYREEFLKQSQELEDCQGDLQDHKIKLRLEKEKTQSVQDSLETCKLEFAKAKLELEGRYNESSNELRHLESELSIERKKSSDRKGLEAKFKQLEDEARILKASTDSFQELNLVLTQKNAELTNALSKIHSTHIPVYIAEQLRGQINEMQGEMLQIKEEHKSKADEGRARVETSLKKVLDEKNSVIHELKGEICKLKERTVQEDNSEIKYLKSALVNKEKELAELKEKGQEYYSQADEVLENMRKKCQSLQNEVNCLREELRSGEYRDLKEFPSQQSRDVRRNRSALRENIDSSGRSRASEETSAIKHMNSVLTEELSKNVEIIELLKRRNLDFSKKLSEVSTANKQLHEEIEKLSEGLGKITDFVFNLPMIKFNPQAECIIESTIKAISFIYEASHRRPPRHCN